MHISGKSRMVARESPNLLVHTDHTSHNRQPRIGLIDIKFRGLQYNTGAGSHFCEDETIV